MQATPIVNSPALSDFSNNNRCKSEEKKQKNTIMKNRLAVEEE